MPELWILATHQTMSNIEDAYDSRCRGRKHFYKIANCGKLDRWQKLTERTWSAKRSFKRKSGSVRTFSSQSACNVRYLVANVPMNGRPHVLESRRQHSDSSRPAEARTSRSHQRGSSGK